MTAVVRKGLGGARTTVVLFVLAMTAVAAATPQAAPTSWISTIVQGHDASSVHAAVTTHGGRVTMDLPIVDGVAAEIPAGAIASLAGDPAIRSMSPNAPLHVQSTPSPIHAATAIYPTVIGANKLWTENINGTSTTVAVIDTGIAKVADFGARVIGGVDFTQEGDPYRDSFGHGTFIAGLIAGDGTSSGGSYKGVAPKANLVSIKIADGTGASDVTHVLAALQWAVSFKSTYGIRVLNLSLGTDSTQPYRLSPLNLAVERAWDSGIVVVVSASNNGPSPKTVSKPGDDPLVITLGAIDDKGTAKRTDDVMAGFSGAGPTAADGITKPDLVAPGRSVISLRAPGSAVDTAYPTSRIGTSYFKGSGTSFSTAITSGAAALVLQREPTLTPNQVKDRLLSKAAAGPAHNANIDGRGSLDVYAAAHSGTFTSANAGVSRSLGTGTIALDRGTLQVQIDTGLLGSILSLLNGLLTVQNKNFNATEYLTNDWSASRWYTSQWYGSRWYATSWYGSRWYGSQWYSTSWYGSRWYATAWE